MANLAFQYVGLDEKSCEFVVSLSHGSIISQHIYNGTGFPLLNLEEQSAANDLAFKYPPFIKSIKKRGLDIKDVVPAVFTVGW